MLFFTCIFHLTFIFVVVNHHHRNKRVANSTCPSTPLAHSHPQPHGSSASRTRYGQPLPKDGKCTTPGDPSPPFISRAIADQAVWSNK